MLNILFLFEILIESFSGSFLKAYHINSVLFHMVIGNRPDHLLKSFKFLFPNCEVSFSFYFFFNSGYLDDIYLQVNSFEQCSKNVMESAFLLDRLGFTIHCGKCVCVKQEDVGVSNREKNVEKIRTVCKESSISSILTIRILVKLVDVLVTTNAGNKYPPVFYKRLEVSRNKSLEKSKGDYEVEIKLTQDVKEDLTWRIGNAGSFLRNIHVFDKIYKMFDVDLFASRISFQLKFYVAWHEDGQALFVDAMHMN